MFEHTFVRLLFICCFCLFPLPTYLPPPSFCKSSVAADPCVFGLRDMDPPGDPAKSYAKAFCRQSSAFLASGAWIFCGGPPNPSPHLNVKTLWLQSRAFWLSGPGSFDPSAGPFPASLGPGRRELVSQRAKLRDPSSQAARQPESQEAREPGSQAARQPGSQGASESGNQGASQPGC